MQVTDGDGIDLIIHSRSKSYKISHCTREKLSGVFIK